MSSAQNNGLIFIWTLLLLNFRPSIVAQSYNPVVMALFFAVSVMVMFFGGRKLNLRFTPKEQLLLGILLLTYTYFFVQGFFLSTATNTVVNSSVVLFGTLPCLFFVLREPENRSLIVKSLINIHFWLSISQIVTFAIFVANGFTLPKSLLFFNLQNITKYFHGEGFSLIHYLVFPFTVSWSSFNLLGVVFYRTCGIYREPGMAQIFYLTTFFLTFFYYDKNIKLKRIVILIGSLLLLAASGFLNIVIGYAVYLLFNRKSEQKMSPSRVLQMSAGIIAGLVLVVFTYDILAFKLKKNSGVERMENVTKSFEQLLENPIIGEGYYNSFKTDSMGKVVSKEFYTFLGVVNQVGLVGVVLYFACWFVGLNQFANRKSWCIYVPCLVTLLSSQPSYNDEFTFFLIIFNSTGFFTVDN